MRREEGGGFSLAVVGKQQQGVFFMFAEHRYWRVCANPHFKTQAVEVAHDWTTQTGLERLENTRPEAEEQ